MREHQFTELNVQSKLTLIHLRCVRLALLFAVASVRADDWPQWRGPNRDGVWRETGILETIPASGLEVRWRAKVGNGYSGPVVAQGRVFVTDHEFNPEIERVLCFDEATGKLLWVHSYSCNYKDMEYGNGPRASPTVHDGKVYTFGTQGHLVCLDAARGEVVWKKNLTTDFHGQIPRYGASAAPLVVGDLLIVCAGGQPEASVVALDRKTGEQRWQALPDRPAYSAPIVINAGGVRQLVVWTADSITGFEPATGKVHWQVPWKAAFDPAQMVASPVWHKDMMLFLGAWSRGSKMLKALGEFTGHTNKVFSAVFSPDGKTLATGSADHTVRLWNVATRKQRAVFDGHADAVWSVAFSADGKTVASASADRTVRLWDATTGKERRTLRGHEDEVRAVTFSPDGRTLATGSADWTVRLWDLAMQQERAVLKEHRGGVQSLAYSSDSSTLATGSLDDTVKLWDVATGKERVTLRGHRSGISAVVFSPDDRTLASAGMDDAVRLWDLTREK